MLIVIISFVCDAYKYVYGNMMMMPICIGKILVSITFTKAAHFNFLSKSFTHIHSFIA